MVVSNPEIGLLIKLIKISNFKILVLWSRPKFSIQNCSFNKSWMIISAASIQLRSVQKKWEVSRTTLNNWLKTCTIKKNKRTFVPKFVSHGCKDQAIIDLRVENARLQREVEYNKFRSIGQKVGCDSSDWLSCLRGSPSRILRNPKTKDI